MQLLERLFFYKIEMTIEKKSKLAGEEQKWGGKKLSQDSLYHIEKLEKRILFSFAFVLLVFFSWIALVQ